MASKTAARAELCRLRRDIARIEGRPAEADRLLLDSALPEASAEVAQASAAARPAGPQSRRAEPFGKARLTPRERRGRLRLGLSALDGLLGGGLPLATLHEIRAGASCDGAAAAGFALALVARLAAAGAENSVFWISEAETRRETGRLYAPGLVALGLDPARVVQVAARTEAEALWAFEAALACPGLGAAICELRQASLDLGATRRCVLRARAAGVTGFLLRLGSPAEPSAAELRFRLAPAPAGEIGCFAPGIGRMAWNLALEKHRGGRTGILTVEWNAHERRFAERSSEGESEKEHAHPQPLPAAAADRPPAAAAGLRRLS